MVLPDSRRVSRALRYSGAVSESLRFCLRGCHPLWLAFPFHSASVVFSYSVDTLGVSSTVPQPLMSNAPRLALIRFGLVPAGYSQVLDNVRFGLCEMPAFTEQQVSDEEVKQIVDYLKTLKE